MRERTVKNGKRYGLQGGGYSPELGPRWGCMIGDFCQVRISSGVILIPSMADEVETETAISACCIAGSFR